MLVEMEYCKASVFISGRKPNGDAVYAVRIMRKEDGSNLYQLEGSSINMIREIAIVTANKALFDKAKDDNSRICELEYIFAVIEACDFIRKMQGNL